jgi:hypothetical protein
LWVGLQPGTNAEAGIVKGFKQNVVKSITTSRTLGFRIVGLRSYQVDTATYISKSMLYGTAPARHLYAGFFDHQTLTLQYKCNMARNYAQGQHDD